MSSLKDLKQIVFDSYDLVEESEGSGGGGLDWSTSAQTTNFVAEVSKGYPVDTSGNVVEVQLPAGVAGMTIAIKDYAQTFGTYHCLLVPNGAENIEGVNGPLKVDMRGAYVTLVYTDATKGWLAVAASAQNPVINKPFMHVQDRKPNGTEGGTSVTGNNARTLNTILSNNIPGASLSSNEVTLPEGDYYIYCSSTIFDGTAIETKQFIKNSSDTILLNSLNARSAAGGEPVVSGLISLAQSTAIKVVTFTSVGEFNGLGQSTDGGTEEEIYTDLQIWKLDSDIKTYTVSDPEMYLKKPLLWVRDEKPSGTDGGTASGDVTRDLNTVKVNEISGASLGSNQITLPAGKYSFNVVSTFGNTQQSILRLKNVTDDTYLVEGVSDGNNASAHNEQTILQGSFDLLSTKVIVLEAYSGGTNADSLGIAMNQGVEVYSDVMIWQEDAVVQAPYVTQPINQPVTGAEVTGNIYGGELVYVDDSNVDVNPISCMDDTTLQEIVVTGVTSISMTSLTINTIYNFFAVRYNDDTYGLEYDTDVNGANLVATVTHKRWVGFVLTDASGDIEPFTMNGDTFSFDGATSVLVKTDSSTTPTALVLTAFIPTTRVNLIQLAFAGVSAGTSTDIYVNDEPRGYASSPSLGSVVPAVYGELLPVEGVSTGMGGTKTINVYLITVTLKR